MKYKIIETSFKKLLGNGWAWRAPGQFMSDFWDVLVSPLAELKNRFISFKFVHFPTILIDKNNIENGEKLFGIIDSANKDLEQRAAEVESKWNSFAGCHTFWQIENYLKKRGFNVRVIENIPCGSGSVDMLHGARKIGNGFLLFENEHKDPIVITDGKHSFIVKFEDFFTKEQISDLIETLVRNKPAHNGVYIILHHLRKKEIHHVLTKRQMQSYRKSQYCDCKTKGGF